MKNKTDQKKNDADVVAISQPEVKDLSRDLCLRIMLVQERQQKLSEQMRSSNLEMEILKREVTDELGLDPKEVTVQLNPAEGKAVVRKAPKPNGDGAN